MFCSLLDYVKINNRWCRQNELGTYNDLSAAQNACTKQKECNNGCKSNVQKWDPSERRKADPVFPAGTAGFRMDNGHFLVIWNFMEWFIGASTSLAHIYI